MKIISLCALLCFMALGCFACGSPRGSGNGSISKPAVKAKAAASVNVASTDINLAKFSIDQTRQVRAVEAVTTAETSEMASRPNLSASTATFREPGALTYRQEPFDHSAVIAKVPKLPNRSTYNGLAGDHYARADV